MKKRSSFFSANHQLQESIVVTAILALIVVFCVAF